MGIGGWISLIGGIVGVIAITLRLLYNAQQKKAGATEAALAAAQRESDRAKRAARIDAETRTRGPDDLEKDLS